MKLRTLFFTIFIIAVLTACNKANQSMPDNEQNSRNLQVQQTNYKQNERLSNNEIADHLANLAAEVPHVNDAVSVVLGPYTVVGIDIDATTTSQRVGTIKYSVSEALSNDPYGKEAVVIADGDIVERIREMGVQIREGRPIRGIADELAEIVSRYMPTFPTDDMPSNDINNQNNGENIQNNDMNDQQLE